MTVAAAKAARWRAAGSERTSSPVLFVIDNDTGVMNALRDDLSRRFGKDFRVIGESAAAAGLAVLRGLAEEHEPVASLIVDYGLSGMTGVDFLARAHAMHSLAKPVLLVERDYSARSPVYGAARTHSSFTDTASLLQIQSAQLGRSVACVASW